MTEFIAAFVFGNNAKAIVETGIIVKNPIKLKDSKNRFVKSRSIKANMRMDEFYKLSLLRTTEQIQLARLYREAFSSNNLYLKILFFWHCLVYPSSSDYEGVKYVNDFVAKLPREMEYMKEMIDRVFLNKVFLGAGEEEKSVGEYIRSSIRHSIAHIVRTPASGVDLALDSWEQVTHLSGIEFFLRDVARYRLENDYQMKANNDRDLFLYVTDDELD
jgi:hypothetical protein